MYAKLIASGMDEKFQSTPDLINRENRDFYLILIWRLMFQSTPDLINRENAKRPVCSASDSGFNPLPI